MGGFYLIWLDINWMLNKLLEKNIKYNYKNAFIKAVSRTWGKFCKTVQIRMVINNINLILYSMCSSLKFQCHGLQAGSSLLLFTCKYRPSLGLFVFVVGNKALSYIHCCLPQARQCTCHTYRVIICLRPWNMGNQVPLR